MFFVYFGAGGCPQSLGEVPFGPPVAQVSIFSDIFEGRGGLGAGPREPLGTFGVYFRRSFAAHTGHERFYWIWEGIWMPKGVKMRSVHVAVCVKNIVNSDVFVT
jgi:hypothetical protein